MLFFWLLIRNMGSFAYLFLPNIHLLFVSISLLIWTQSKHLSPQSYLNFQFWKLRRTDWLLRHSRLWAFATSIIWYYFTYNDFSINNLISHCYCCFHYGKSFLSNFVCISCFTWRVWGISSAHCHIRKVLPAATWRWC